MNVPDRFELFVLPEGVKKVAIAPDTKIPNMATFTVQKEDHTLGNVLARQLQFQAGIAYAGYKMPHPLDHSFVLRVQTDGSLTPTAAVQQGVDLLIGQLAILEDRLRAEVKRFRTSGRRLG